MTRRKAPRGRKGGAADRQTKLMNDLPLNTAHLERIQALRAELFQEIEAMLKEDGHCKSYEGAIEIVLPNYFANKGEYPERLGLRLHCYLLGPARHHEWFGESFDAVLTKAETDIRLWIAESRATREEPL